MKDGDIVTELIRTRLDDARASLGHARAQFALNQRLLTQVSTRMEILSEEVNVLEKELAKRETRA